MKLFSGHFDLPLSRDTSTKLLPWIVGLMVYLATLALATVVLLAGVLEGLDQGLKNKITVQIMPVEAETLNDNQVRESEVIHLLERTSGILKVATIPLTEIASMVEPWLGTEAHVLELPFPTLIDVTLEEDSVLDIQNLSNQLATKVPGSSIDDHKFWRERLYKMIRALEGMAALVAVLVMMAAIAVVVFATRGGLAVHRELIEVMHLIGARDEYIADQFQRHVWRNCLLGSSLAGFLGFVTLLGFRQVSSKLDSSLFPIFEFEIWKWAMFILIPIVASLIAMWTARLTVLRVLTRLV